MREDVEAIIAALGPIHGRLLMEGSEGSAESIIDAAEALRALLAERDTAFAAGQRDMQERAAEKCKWHSDKLIETIRALPINPRP